VKQANSKSTAQPARVPAKAMTMKTKKTMQLPPLTKAEGDAELVKIEAGPAQLARTRKALREATGGRSDEVSVMICSQVDALQRAGGGTTESAVLSMKTIGEMAPGNVMEAMLAVQMIGVHNAAVEFLRRSQLPDQTVGSVDTNVTRASRLSGLFIRQLEAMAKLRGTAGRQKMTVEHVHVHAGGQAIVGPVVRGNVPPGDGGAK
jgi:hypothetical protein